MQISDLAHPMAAKAAAVAALFKALANEKRLLLLCRLLETGEASVGALAEAVGLGQSPTSQHLAVMREEGLVAARRESQTMWYRIADPRLEALLAQVRVLYCEP